MFSKRIVVKALAKKTTLLENNNNIKSREY